MQAEDSRISLENRPLLPLQQSMAISLHLSGPEGVDLEQLVWRMDRPKPAAVIEAAFRAVARRHEALRVAFSLDEDGTPSQALHGEVSVSLGEIVMPTEEAWREQAIARFLETDRSAGLQLDKAPAWRISLLHFGPEAAALVWTFPHALLDGRSVSLILTEIAADLAGKTDVDGKMPDPPDTVLADYLAWRTALDHAGSLEQWAKRLGDFSGGSEFPRDPAGTGDAMVTQELVLAPSALAPIQATAARLNVTVNTFCQAAWALVLASQSGRSDVVFAAVRACRQQGSTSHSQLAGMLMNSVPVRASPTAEKKVADFLAELRAWQIEVRACELAPLEEIQRAARVPPGSLLCNSVLMFDHERAWERAAALLGPGHEFSLRERPSMPVTLSVTAGRTLDAKLMARGNVMGEDAADRVLRQFVHFLQELARNPDARLGELDLITPEERFRHLEVYNATSTPYPEKACLHHAFEAQAETSAGRAAVFAPDGVMTYGQLEQAANRLAHHLISLGVAPGGLVVIRLAKSTQLPVAMFAALKAGCGYVPVDPNWPTERLAHIVECTRAAAVVGMSEGWPESVQHSRAVLLDRDRAAIASASAIRPAISRENAGIAYVIFTSGSTGTPKGVVIDHRGVVNTVADCNARFALGPSDRLFGISAPTFDLSVYDIFGPLSVGGAVVLCPEEESRSPETWRRLVEEYHVTVWNSVPQIVEMLVEGIQDRRHQLASLRLVMMSGDWIPTGLPGRIRFLLPRAEIWGLGGATEASIWSIGRPIHEVDPDWPSIPYGRPMANQSFFVLDEQLRPCPTLVPGDLFIGGTGLARGYWDDAERTNRSFLIHPRWNVRLYRTGDRGRFLPSNEIEFLGRNDNQVKLGGYRIELGEIEHAMARLPWVRQCAASEATLAAGSEALVGYVVPTQEAAFDAEALRDHLRSTLPAYMVPALLMKLERLPISANGKVDRRALPRPPTAEQTATVEWSDSEQEMAAIWEQVLSLKPDSPNRSFFEYGGNSLLAFRLIELIKRRTGRQLHPGTMFESRPTIRSMARELATAAPDDEAAAAGESDLPRWLVPMRTSGTRPPFFFLAQYLDIGRYISHDRPFYGVLIGSELRLELPKQNFTEIAATILREIRRVQAHGPYYFGGYCFAAVLAFEIALQLQEQGEKIAYFCMVEAAAPAGIEPPAPVKWSGLRYGLSQLWKGLFTHPIRIVTKGMGRILDNIRLNCLGLTAERLFGDFTPRPYDGPIDLYLCHDSPNRVVPERDPRLGWAKWCTGLAVTEVPGNHLTMLREPLIRSLAPLIESRLDAAGPRGFQSPADGAANAGRDKEPIDSERTSLPAA